MGTAVSWAAADAVIYCHAAWPHAHCRHRSLVQAKGTAKTCIIDMRIVWAASPSQASKSQDAGKNGDFEFKPKNARTILRLHAHPD